ncbi:MAG: HAD family hydrolase [Nitrososphaeria archaeon]|nr:HAD family hydrolase [Nitrososphaeria archaeon]
MPKITTVLFDLGGTLIKGSDILEVARVYATILKRYNVVREVEDIAKVYDELNSPANLKEIVLMEGRFWINFNLRLLEKLEVRDDIEKIADAMDRMWWDHVNIVLYEDVIETLEKLYKNSIILGIISNSLENDIEHILDITGIKEYFKIKVGIDTFKCVKPEKEIFIKTLTKFNLKREKTLFVGDSLENDYMGAINAGVSAILVDRKDKIREKGVKKVKCLVELVNFV